MNVFKDFTDNISQGVEQIGVDINTTVDVIKKNLGIIDNIEVDAVLMELRNGRKVESIEPEMIENLTDEEARVFILRQMKENNIRIFDETLPMYSNDEPLPSLEPLATLPPAEEASIDEDTDELLQDPQTSDIFDELRSEFPETTPTSAPPSIAIEGFEDVTLSNAQKINNQLKQKFIDNFKF